MERAAGLMSSSECLQSERLHFFVVSFLFLFFCPLLKAKHPNQSRLCCVLSGVCYQLDLGHSSEALPAAMPWAEAGLLAGSTQLSRPCCATHPTFQELWVLGAHTWEAHEPAGTNLHFLCMWLCHGRGHLLKPSCHLAVA